MNMVAAIVGVAANWPSQFGGVGTNAGDEVLTRGTAVSAPLLPIAIVVASLLLVWRGGRGVPAGAVGAGIAAALFFVGAIGELTAEETEDTPKTVLVVAGVAWIVVALTLTALAVGAFLEWRRRSSQVIAS